MSNKTLLLSIVCLVIGFTCGYLIFGNQSQPLPTNIVENQTSTNLNERQEISYQTVPVTEDSNVRFEYIENDIQLIQQQLQEIEFAVDETRDALINNKQTTLSSAPTANKRPRNRQRSYSIEQLIRGGIDSAIAEDIIRRKNAVEISRLELSDRATRENYLNTQRYLDELAEIDQNEVNVREELGDDQYDEFLFKSKQTNRIRITSVMLGSAAEQAGLEKNDIILSYDNKRMFTWSELKQATAEGELGDYTTINISRKGEVFSYSIPRGTIGIQMGAARLAP